MAVRALNASGSGSNADIADAFTYAAANGAKVVNASLGGPGARRRCPTRSPTTRTRCSSSPPATTAQNNDTTPAYPCNYTART